MLPILFERIMNYNFENTSLNTAILKINSTFKTLGIEEFRPNRNLFAEFQQILKTHMEVRLICSIRQIHIFTGSDVSKVSNQTRITWIISHPHTIDEDSWEGEKHHKMR